MTSIPLGRTWNRPDRSRRLPGTRPLSLLLLLAPLALHGCAAATSGEGDGPSERQAYRSQMPERPYSQAVRAGNLYFLSGKVGVTPETEAMTSGRTAAEVRNVMEAFRELLDELGLEFDDVVSATVFLADIGDYDDLNRVYGSYFGDDPPARETVAVRDIVGGAAVEISLIAVAH